MDFCSQHLLHGESISVLDKLTDDCCFVPTALSAFCGQLTFRLAWCREHSAYGDRTFAVGGLGLRNSLPVQLRNPDITYGLFRQQLKGHLFFEKQEHGAL